MLVTSTGPGCIGVVRGCGSRLPINKLIKLRPTHGSSWSTANPTILTCGDFRNEIPDLETRRRFRWTGSSARQSERAKDRDQAIQYPVRGSIALADKAEMKRGRQLRRPIHVLVDTVAREAPAFRTANLVEFHSAPASLVRSSHTRHDRQLLSTRVRYQIHSLIEDGNLSWAQSLLAPLMRS